MNDTILPTRIEHRFIGNNEVCYGKGSNHHEALNDARARLGEPMEDQDDIDECGYLIEVEMERQPHGEWVDVK